MTHQTDDPAILYADDPSIRQGDDGNWYHYPNHPIMKLVFLLFSLSILALGVWCIWEPAARFFNGKRDTAKVTRIIRTEPGKDPEIIRYRKDIPEGEYFTKFSYEVTVGDGNKTAKVMTLGVGSKRNAYANWGDEVEVIYFEKDDYAYGLFHHRTWAFGAGFLFVGLVLTITAIPTLYMVGKPIKIDP
jgi:hypothetical protein